jgi:hypothetical protein
MTNDAEEISLLLDNCPKVRNRDLQAIVKQLVENKPHAFFHSGKVDALHIP